MTTDVTTNQTDPSVATQDALKGEKVTSDATKTYTESDVQKIVSDRLAKAGREAKAFEAKEEALRQREEAQAQRDREQEEREYEKVRGNPDALSKWQAERDLKKERDALQKDRDALEREKVEHQVALEAAQKLTNAAQISAIATKYKVDVAILNDFGLNVEQTEKIAQRLSSLPPAELAKLTKPQQPANENPPKKRDSGVTLGGGSTNLGDLSPKDRLKEIDRRIREQS